VRTVVVGLLVLGVVVGAVLGWWWLVGIAAVLLAVALYDVLQRTHAVLRNYPVVGHLRYLLELMRPELQQYFIERNFDGRPYDRDTRSIIYQRAKGIEGVKAFGTETQCQRGRLRVPRPRDRGVPVAAQAAAGPDRRSALHAAVRHGAAQRVGDELRGAVGQRDRGAQCRRGPRWFRP